MLIFGQNFQLILRIFCHNILLSKSFGSFSLLAAYQYQVMI